MSEERPPRVGDRFGGGVVRTVETLVPRGHYRITIDVDLTADSSAGPASAQGES